MGNYKREGPLGHAIYTREYRIYIITFAGDEFPFLRKGDAERYAKSLLASGHDIKLEEETTIRSIMPDHNVKENKFRIDMTNRIKNEILADSLSPSGENDK